MKFLLAAQDEVIKAQAKVNKNLQDSTQLALLRANLQTGICVAIYLPPQRL